MAETLSSRKYSITRWGLAAIVSLGIVESLPFTALSEESLSSLVWGITVLIIGYCGGNVGEWWARRK